MEIKYAGQVIYDNSNESVWETFKDKWLSKFERADFIEYYVGVQNWRKLTSKDDSGASSGNTTKVQDVLMYSLFGRKQRIKLCRVLEDTGLFVPNSMMNDLEYIIRLPPTSEVLVKQTGETAANYSLENLELEYETIMNDDLANQITSMLSTGKSLIYEHVTMFKKIAWPKADTVQNISVNVSRKSVRAIVLFFKDDNADNEVLPYPKISKIKIIIKGKPNQVYSRDLKQHRLYEEPFRYFSNKIPFDQSIIIAEFFKDTFCLSISELMKTAQLCTEQEKRCGTLSPVFYLN